MTKKEKEANAKKKPNAEGEHSATAATAPPTQCNVVYIHGIANKPAPSILKDLWDTALFGKEMGDRTRAAYWADILYDRPLEAMSLALAADVMYDRFLEPMNSDYAAKIWAAMSLEPSVAPTDVLDDEPATAAGAAFETFILPTDRLRRLATQHITQTFIRDTHAYFFEPGIRKAIRDRLRALMPPSKVPYIVVSHSQGTIIAYDVLHELSASEGVQCLAWYTLGSPLGIGEVQTHLRLHDDSDKRHSRELSKPKCVDTWLNFADRFDAVALDTRLDGDFKPKGCVTDTRVRNLDRWNLVDFGAHSATGYLGTTEVRTSMSEILGGNFADYLADFVIAKDLASEIDGIAKRLPVLIELDEAAEGSTAEDKGKLLEARIMKLMHDAPGKNGNVTRLKRFVAAQLTPAEIVRLASERAELKISRIWRDSQKAALIRVSAHVVHAYPAQQGYLAKGDGIHWAVLDTGITAAHPHFTANGTIAAVWDCTQGGTGVLPVAAATDPNGHGTHVSGIIAGEYTTPSGERYSGMAPLAKLHAYKVLDDNGYGNDSFVIKALDHIAETNEQAGRLVIHGVNLSLGGPFDARVYGCGHSPICSELRRLWRQGVLVCVAAGNSGQAHIMDVQRRMLTLNLDLSIGDPANLEEAIAVGSVHRDKPQIYGPSFFSSRGPTADGRMKPDLVAPGEGIVSCNNQTNESELYRPDSGTSMACPHVSGILAGFLSARREYIGFPDRVKRILLEHCTTLDRDPLIQGRGMPNLIKMLTAT